MSDLHERLAMLREELENEQYTLAHAKKKLETAEGIERVVYEEAIKVLKRKVADRYTKIAETEEQIASEELASSAEVALLHAVADAFHYDYLYSEDYVKVLKRVHAYLEERGLRFEMVPLDD